jgi:hypothetical protein
MLEYTNNPTVRLPFICKRETIALNLSCDRGYRLVKSIVRRGKSPRNAPHPLEGGLYDERVVLKQGTDNGDYIGLANLRAGVTTLV